MTFQSTKQNIDLINQDEFDFIIEFHDYLKGERNIIDGDFKKYFPYLTLCEFKPTLTLAPKIIYSGSLSGTRQVFGQKWAEKLSSNKTTPDEQLETLSAPGYQEAADEGFSCDIIDTVIKTEDGEKTMRFLRYIAQIETYSDLKFFALAGKVLDRNLQ